MQASDPKTDSLDNIIAVLVEVVNVWEAFGSRKASPVLSTPRYRRESTPFIPIDVWPPGNKKIIGIEKMHAKANGTMVSIQLQCKKEFR